MHSSSCVTADHDEALAYVQRTYHASFRAARTSEPFYMNLRSTDYGPWETNDLRFDAGGFGVGPYGVVSVCRLTAGRLNLTLDRDTLLLQKGDIAVMADGARPLMTSWDGAHATILRIPGETLRRVGQESAGVPDGAGFALLSRRPVSPQAGRRFTQVAGFAQRHLAEGLSPPDHVTLDAVAHLLAAAVLTTFPNTLVSTSSVLQPRNDVPHTVAAALDFVARNADLPITPADIATHAGVSRRVLEMAFREHLSNSPAAYLRQYRLARVHDELRSAVPGDGISVAQVAARWTFRESSRFVAHYRRVYGELPSQTLRS